VSGLRLCVFVLLFTAGYCSTPDATRADLFSLRIGGRGNSVDLSSLRNNNASVFVFLAPDCPLSQNYTLTLNDLRARFEADSIAFLGVVPGQWFDAATVDSFARTYMLTFPLVVDEELRLTTALGAAVTPEVFVIDSMARIVYQGAIDNWANDLTRRRTAITEHYLRDALTHYMDGEAVPRPKTEAIGCFIETARQ
jgi:peroxiredoxin